MTLCAKVYPKDFWYCFNKLKFFIQFEGFIWKKVMSVFPQFFFQIRDLYHNFREENANALWWLHMHLYPFYRNKTLWNYPLVKILYYSRCSVCLTRRYMTRKLGKEAVSFNPTYSFNINKTLFDWIYRKPLRLNLTSTFFYLFWMKHLQFF